MAFDYTADWRPLEWRFTSFCFPWWFTITLDGLIIWRLCWTCTLLSFSVGIPLDLIHIDAHSIDKTFQINIFMVWSSDHLGESTPEFLDLKFMILIKILIRSEYHVHITIVGTGLFELFSILSLLLDRWLQGLYVVLLVPFESASFIDWWHDIRGFIWSILISPKIF